MGQKTAHGVHEVYEAHGTEKSTWGAHVSRVLCTTLTLDGRMARTTLSPVICFVPRCHQLQERHNSAAHAALVCLLFMHLLLLCFQLSKLAKKLVGNGCLMN